MYTPQVFTHVYTLIHCLETIFFVVIPICLFFYVKWVVNYTTTFPSPERATIARTLQQAQRVAKPSTAGTREIKFQTTFL